MRKKLTPEQIEAKRQYERKRLAEMTPEQKAAMREYQRQWRQRLSPEQKQARREREREYDRRRAACEGPEKKDARKKYYKEWSAIQENKDRALNRRKVAVSRLAPSYVASIVGIPTRELTSELLDLKREQLTLARLSRDLKNALKETENG